MKTGDPEMSEDQIKALWARTDEHGRLITDLTIEQRTQAASIIEQGKRFEQFLKDQERSRAEILEAIRGHHQREGVKDFFKISAPWVAASIAFVALLWSMAR